MERSPTRDFIVGIFVLLGIIAIFYLSVSIGGVSWRGREGLKVYADFNETGSLAVRAPVVIAGVRVGEVTRISLDNGTRAKVEMSLDPDLSLPKDSVANIVTAGVLGDRYIELEPGQETIRLATGGMIAKTGDAILLEKAVQRLVDATGGGYTPPTRLGLKLYASFDESGSLAAHAPVVVAGVCVGEVTRISLSKNLRARVEMNLDPDLKLPTDTLASVVTPGVLGGKFIELGPGAEDQMLKSGDTITHVEGAVVLEKVLKQFAHATGGGYTLPTKLGLKLYASYDESGSLAAHAAVVVAGVCVGEVTSISLDKDFRARVEMNLDPDLKLPTDTFANIVTAGVLGDRYVELQPGGEDQTLKSGDTIAHTQNAIILEKLIGDFLYGMSKADKPPSTQPARTP